MLLNTIVISRRVTYYAQITNQLLWITWHIKDKFTSNDSGILLSPNKILYTFVTKKEAATL